MSGSTRSIVEKLRARLRRARRRLAAGRTANGLLTWIAIGLTALLAVIGIEATFWLGVGLRTLLFWVFLGGLIAALAWGLWPVLRALGILPGEDDRAVARRAETKQPGAGDRIAAFLDLAQDDGKDAAAPLRDSAILALGTELESIPFEQLDDYRPAKRVAPWAAAAGCALLLFAMGWPGTFSAATGRVLSPGMAFVRPAPYAFSVEPGNATISRGEDIDIIVNTEGSQLPPQVSIEYGRLDEEAIETRRMRQVENDTPGRFAHTLTAPPSSFRYRITSPEATTPWFRVEVEPRPFIRNLQVTVTPPGYTGRSAQRLAPGVGDVSALVGSTIRLNLELGDETAEEGTIDIAWEDGRQESVPLSIRGTRATAQLPVRRAGRYHVTLRDAEGAENLNPARYAIATLLDAPPQITLLDGFSEPLDNQTRHVSVHITDDFGFSGAALHWRYAERREGGSTAFQTLALRLQSAELDQVIETGWRPSDLRAGDIVEIYGSVRDNDRPAGGKRAETPVVTLRFPTLREQFEDFNAAQDSTRESLDRLRTDAEEVRERMRELREEIQRDPQNLDWEDRRQLDQLQTDQEQLSQEAEDVRRQMEELTQRLQESDMANPETRRLYEQMRQVMDELQDPSLREALERLRRAMEEVDLRDLLESSEQAAQDQERLLDRIDRAIEMLERVKVQQQLDQSALEAEDLAERQDDIRERTREADESQSTENTLEELRSEQESAAQESESLEEGIRELQEQMESMSNTPRSEMEELQQQLEEQSPSEPMQEAAEQMENNQLQDAQQNQQQGSQQLRQMASQMREMGEQMQSEQNQVDIQALRRSLEDVLTLSKQQEELADRTSGLDVRTASLRPYARDQVRIRDGLQSVADTLARVSKTVPQLGMAVTERVDAAQREVGQAMEELGNRRTGPASAHQRSTMSHLNELALVLAEVLEQVQNQMGGSGSGSMAQQLQQMGEAQQQLNKQIQQMLNETAGERLSRSQEQRMREMGEAQERIRQQLQRAQQQGGGTGENGEGGQLDAQTQSDLARIEEEMQEAAEKLRERNLDDRTAPQQHEILERLLQAEKSVNRRGREEQREAEGAQSRTRTPGNRPVDQGRPEIQIRRDLIRALESGYTRDYQDLIKRYYERRMGRGQ